MSEDRDKLGKLGENDELGAEDDDVEAHVLGADDRDVIGNDDRDVLGDSGERKRLE
jgi:hypothetical protein